MGSAHHREIEHLQHLDPFLNYRKVWMWNIGIDPALLFIILFVWIGLLHVLPETGHMLTGITLTFFFIKQICLWQIHANLLKLAEVLEQFV